MPDNRKKGIIDAEQKVLATALSRPNLRKYMREVLTEEDFSEAWHKTIFNVVINLSDEEGGNEVRGKLGDNPELMEAFSRMITRLEGNSGDPDKLFFEALDWLVSHSRESRQKTPLFEEKIKKSEKPDLDAMRSFQELVLRRHQTNQGERK